MHGQASGLLTKGTINLQEIVDQCEWDQDCICFGDVSVYMQMYNVRAMLIKPLNNKGPD